MKKKNLSYIIMMLLIATAFYFYRSAAAFKLSRFDTTIIKANFFPKVLCVLLAFFSIIYIIKTKLLKDETVVELPNLKYLIIAVAITVAYLFSWQTFGNFYIFTFIYLFLLFTVFLDKEQITKNVVGLNLFITTVMCIFIYGFFQIAMAVRF